MLMFFGRQDMKDHRNLLTISSIWYGRGWYNESIFITPNLGHLLGEWAATLRTHFSAFKLLQSHQRAVVLGLEAWMPCVTNGHLHMFIRMYFCLCCPKAKEGGFVGWRLKLLYLNEDREKEFHFLLLENKDDHDVHFLWSRVTICGH